MKRLIIVTVVVLALATVAGAGRADAAFWPANCDAQMRAGHPVLALQCVDNHLNNLRRALIAQRAKTACLTRTRMSSYLAYAWYENDGSVHVLQDTTDFSDSFSAADFGQAIGDTSAPDYWVVAVRNTAACRAKFGLTANPYAALAAVSESANRTRLARVR
jgi:hypothetical protein